MDKYQTIITKSPKETQEFGKTLAADLTKRGSRIPHIICLYGDLGMGKTTFVQGFAKALGITTRLLSPTFIIVRRYQLSHIERWLYHLDLYRIREAKDMSQLGLSEIFADTNNIVVIEWADRLGTNLPDNRLDVHFSSGANEEERRIDLYMKQNEENIIKKAIDVVNNGGIIIFPTDTAFGVGCRIDKHDAIDKLFVIRDRPVTQALPVLVRSKEQALTYYQHSSDIVRRLMNQYWPGALTIVDECKKDLIYSPIRGGGDTVGLRWPKHELLQQILRGVDVPIVGPSANIHGRATPYSLADLDPEFVSRVDFIVPGVCSVGQSSTVVDCTVTPYRIIRQGAVKL